MLSRCRQGDLKVTKKKEPASRFDGIFGAIRAPEPNPTPNAQRPIPTETEGDRLSKGKDPGYQRTTVYLPKALHRKLKAAALNDEREMSDIIEELITEWLASRHLDV
jgi:hypothetical protein